MTKNNNGELSKNHNAECTCWNCPAIDLTGRVDFRSCGQSREDFSKELGEDSESYIVAECHRRHQLGLYDPMTVTLQECPEWKPTPYGRLLKGMRVMILGIDGYLGWTLALWLGSLGLLSIIILKCSQSFLAGVRSTSRRNISMVVYGPIPPRIPTTFSLAKFITPLGLFE